MNEPWTDADLLEVLKRIDAYAAGRQNAQNRLAPPVVPDDCMYPDEWIGGFCDALRSQIDRLKGVTR